MKKEKEKAPVLRKILSIIGVVISALALPVLIINLVFLVQSFLHPDEVPSVFGITPMVVVTESMKPTINGGDMIIDKKVNPEDVQVGDIISFFDPTRKDHDIVVTHRVKAVNRENGNITFRTKGDANSIVDPVEIPASELVGVYQKTIPVLGPVVLFMKTPIGVLVSVILPILAILTYDLIRRKKEEERVKQMEKELSEQLATVSVTGQEAPKE